MAIRVSSTGDGGVVENGSGADEDASMVDMGRPPDDVIERGRVWVEKVKERNEIGEGEVTREGFVAFVEAGVRAAVKIMNGGGSGPGKSLIGAVGVRSGVVNGEKSYDGGVLNMETRKEGSGEKMIAKVDGAINSVIDEGKEGGGKKDTFMLDGGRMPDNPSSSGLSWAEKVKRSGGVGISMSEKMVENEFVKERVQLSFPDGEEGEPVVIVDQEVIDAMSNLWKNCMYVKVLGRHIALPILVRRLREMWKPSGNMWVIDLPRQFYMIRFEKEEDYHASITRGPWRVFGHCLLTHV